MDIGENGLLIAIDICDMNGSAQSPDVTLLRYNRNLPESLISKHSFSCLRAWDQQRSLSFNVMPTSSAPKVNAP